MKLTFFHIQVLVTVAMAGLLCTAGCGYRSGQADVDRGIAEIRAGNYDNAVRLLDRAASREPDSASAHCNLGIAYWKTGRRNQAISSLQKATEIDQMDPVPFEFLAQIFAEKEDWTQARKALEEASERAPASARIMTARGVLELHADNLHGGYDFLMQAEESDSEYQPALYNLAVLYRDRIKNRKLAARYFIRYLDSFARSAALPGSKPTREDVQRIETARKFTAGREASRPRLAAPLVEAARAAIADSRPTEALILLKDAIAKDPRDPDALWELARFYDEQLGYSNEAAKLYARFAAAFPGDERVDQIPGDEDAGDVAAAALEATPVVEPVAAEGPKSAAPAPPAEVPKQDTAREIREKALKLWQQGVDRHDKKDLDGAISFYLKALALDPRCEHATYNLGLAYMDKKVYDKARDAFLQTLEIKPEMVSARCLLGRMYMFLENNPKAVEELNRVLREDPDHVQANYYVAAVYLREKQIGMAETHLEQCIRFEPNGYYGRRSKSLLVQLKSVKKPPVPSGARRR